MSTTDLQFSRMVAFFQADERPIFSGFRSASIARSQVWLGLPILLIVSSHMEAFGLLLRLNDDDLKIDNNNHIIAQ